MAKFEIYDRVNVSLSNYQYTITICSNGLSTPEFCTSFVSSEQVFIVTNDTVAPLYLNSLQEVFKEKQCDVLVLPDGEEHKNQKSLFAIYNELVTKMHHRDTTLIALGGGVIGDLVGFAASTYQRGVSLIQIPTTLLSQVDSSVGGKTGINHPAGKNMIGSFFHPKVVLIDVTTLTTLPEREFNAGLGEVIKYAWLEGGEFFKRVQRLLSNTLTRESKELPQLISDCCTIKSRFVQADEKESGERALLNLGHTFAHALEAYTHYQQWLHGEAVGIGLFCAANLSYQLGLIDRSALEEMEHMLLCANLPHKIPKSVDLNKLFMLMSLDKKVKNGCLRFVLMKKPGNCYLDSTVSSHYVHKALVASVEGD